MLYKNNEDICCDDITARRILEEMGATFRETLVVDIQTGIDTFETVTPRKALEMIRKNQGKIIDKYI